MIAIVYIENKDHIFISLDTFSESMCLNLKFINFY